MRKHSLTVFLAFFLAPLCFVFAQQPPVPNQPPKPDFKSDPLFEELVKEVEKAGPILKDPGNAKEPGNNPDRSNGQATPRRRGDGPPFSNQPNPLLQDPNYRQPDAPGQLPRMEHPNIPQPTGQPFPPQHPHNQGEVITHQPHPLDPAEMQWHAIENLLRSAREIRAQAELLRTAGRGDKADRLVDLANQLRLAALDSAPLTEHQTPPNR